MKLPDILDRDKSGELITLNDPEYYKIVEILNEARQLTAELNQSFHDDEEIRNLLNRLIGSDVDETVQLFTPFYTDFRKNIRIGKRVFINHACTFMDRGGITIGDDALIGPKVNLITINHPIDPAKRRSTISNPIVIGKNVWIGAGATVLPGVTIGENSVIAAAAVVIKDVPSNTVVAGVPARIVSTIE